MHPTSRIGSYPRRARCPKDEGATSNPPGCAEAWQVLLPLLTGRIGYRLVVGLITIRAAPRRVQPTPPCGQCVSIHAAASPRNIPHPIGQR